MYDGHPVIFKCDLPLPQISWIHDSGIIWNTRFRNTIDDQSYAK